MAIVFQDLTKRRSKGKLSDSEIEACATRSATLFHFVRAGDEFAEVGNTAFRMRPELGEAEIVFVARDGSPSKVQAATAEFGAAMDCIGDGRLAFKAKGMGDGTELCVSMSPELAAHVACNLLAAVDRLDDADGLKDEQRHAVAAAKDLAAELIFNQTEVREEVEREIRGQMAAAFEAKLYSMVMGVERKVEAVLLKRQAATLRKLAQALSMEPGEERSALIAECEPELQKAFAQ